MKNIKKQHWVFCIIFCVFLIFVFSCGSGSSNTEKKTAIEKRAEALLKAKDYSLALELLNEGIKQNPENPKLRALKTKVLAKLGKFIEATEEYFRFYNFTEKHNPKLLYELALSEYMAVYKKYEWEERDYKIDVAFGLAMVGDKDGISTLRECLEDKEIRLEAAKALASLGDKSGIDVLEQAFNSKSRGARLEGAEALASLGDKSGIDFLKKNLADRNFSAAEALARLGDKSGIDVLKGALNSKSMSVRRDAAKALASLGDKSGIDFLKKNLEDGDLRAAVALAGLGDKSSITFLKKALEHEREAYLYFQDLAIALARVGDKSIIPFLTEMLKETYKEEDGLYYCHFLILSLYKLTK